MAASSGRRPLLRLFLLLIGSVQQSANASVAPGNSEAFGVLSSRVATPKGRKKGWTDDDAVDTFSSATASPPVRASPPSRWRDDTWYEHPTDSKQEGSYLDDSEYEDEDADEYGGEHEVVKYGKYEPRSVSFSETDGTLSHREDDLHTEETVASRKELSFLQIPCRIALLAVENVEEVTMASSWRRQIPEENAQSAVSIVCCCDTGAERTVMSQHCMQQCGLEPYLDRRYAGQAIGVGGSCRVLGRIPAGIVELQMQQEESHASSSTNTRAANLMAPSITVIERVGADSGVLSTSSNEDDTNKSIDLLLGLDFLRDHRAVLDLHQEEMQLHVNGRSLRIPFMRSGGPTAVGEPYSRSRDAQRPSSRRANEMDDYAEFSDDAEFDYDLEGVDLSGV